jgi:hypothetical protein
MKRVVFCSGVLVLVVAAACSLPAIARQSPLPPLGSVENSVSSPPIPTEPVTSRPVSPTPPLAKAPSIDDLLNKLDSLKAQKAAIEKAEKETVELLKEKLKEQKHRLKRLGVNVDDGNSVQPATPPPPPVTSSS